MCTAVHVSGSSYQVRGSQVIFINGKGTQLRGFRFDVPRNSRLCLYNLKLDGGSGKVRRVRKENAQKIHSVDVHASGSIAVQHDQPLPGCENFLPAMP